MFYVLFTRCTLRSVYDLKDLKCSIAGPVAGWKACESEAKYHVHVQYLQVCKVESRRLVSDWPVSSVCFNLQYACEIV